MSFVGLGHDSLGSYGAPIGSNDFNGHFSHSGRGPQKSVPRLRTQLENSYRSTSLWLKPSTKNDCHSSYSASKPNQPCRQARRIELRLSG